MSISNGVRANASNFNNAFMSRTSNTDTTGQLDLNNTAPASGSSVANIQRVINSIASALGMTTGEVFNYLITWADDSVGNPNDTLVARIEALVERLNGVTGHTHDGTDGGGPLLLSVAQTQDTNTGFIDALDVELVGSIQLTGNAPTTLRGIAYGVAGKRVVVTNLTGFSLDILDNDANPPAANKISTGTLSTLTLEDGQAAFFEYDGLNSIWRAISGSGGGNFLINQEIPSGVIDGVNDTFGPFSQTPASDSSISVFVDGVYRAPSTYTITGGDTIVFDPGEIPQLGQSVEVAYLYKISGNVVPSPGLSVTPKTEFITLSGAEITAQQLTLVNTPSVPSEILVNVYGGSVAFYGVDYTVSGNIVSWGGLGFDGLLSSGDRLVIHYYY